MLYHVYLSPKLSSWCMGYTKRNKRCIPKEGMPHAHKACQKKREREKMHTQRRYATCPQGVLKKIKEERKRRKYSPYLRKKYYKGERPYEGVSSTIHQKYPHTCTSWSSLMTCFTCGSGLWLSKIWEQVAYTSYIPTDPPKRAIRSRMEKKRT